MIKETYQGSPELFLEDLPLLSSNLSSHSFQPPPLFISSTLSHQPSLVLTLLLHPKHLNLVKVVFTIQTHFLGVVPPKLREHPLSVSGIFRRLPAVDVPLRLEETVRLLVVPVVSGGFRREGPERGNDGGGGLALVPYEAA